MIDYERYLEQFIRLFEIYQCKVENIILPDRISCILLKKICTYFFYLVYL